MQKNCKVQLIKFGRKIDHPPIEILYVLAIRFYDLGRKEDDIYWFYTAQFHRNIYAKMVENAAGIGNPAFEQLQAQSTFNEIVFH